LLSGPPSAPGLQAARSACQTLSASTVAATS
jgi:hypothetical protein